MGSVEWKGCQIDTNDLIAAQIAYYRARAAQYDGELARSIDHERWPEFWRRFESEKQAIENWVKAYPPTGHVLEIAAGTGARTDLLLPGADRVTALDAAPEMLAILRAKHPRVEVIEADVFSWDPPQAYDNVFMGYWISHVPAARWESFWRTVDKALAPGGRVWFMDNAHPDYSTANGPGDWPVVAGLRGVDATDTEIRERTLEDGSSWTLVKRYWWPGELMAELGALGWLATVGHTEFAFIYGTAVRA